jgi:formate dehydrogenase iron-sulfur subunit
MKAILTDVTRCVGCEKCVAACAAENRQAAATAPQRWTLDDGLSADRFTAVVRRDGGYVRKQCRHCLEPACAEACPVGALRKTPEGPVVYDGSRCLGCRYCMMACPFGIPRYAWASPVPYVRKCNMCHENRIAKGRQPACTEACPEKATVFGEREALLEEAHRRMRDVPSRYQPRIWGEFEVGGTSVVYLSPIPLDFLHVGGRPPAGPLPERTAPAMAAVPPVFVGMGAVMGSLYWVIGRRRKLTAGGHPQSDQGHDGSREKKP